MDFGASIHAVGFAFGPSSELAFWFSWGHAARGYNHCHRPPPPVHDLISCVDRTEKRSLSHDTQSIKNTPTSAHYTRTHMSRRLESTRRLSQTRSRAVRAPRFWAHSAFVSRALSLSDPRSRSHASSPRGYAPHAAQHVPVGSLRLLPLARPARGRPASTALALRQRVGGSWPEARAASRA